MQAVREEPRTPSPVQQQPPTPAPMATTTNPRELAGRFQALPAQLAEAPKSAGEQADTAAFAPPRAASPGQQAKAKEASDPYAGLADFEMYLSLGQFEEKQMQASRSAEKAPAQAAPAAVQAEPSEKQPQEALYEQRPEEPLLNALLRTERAPEAMAHPGDLEAGMQASKELVSARQLLAEALGLNESTLSKLYAFPRVRQGIQAAAGVVIGGLSFLGGATPTQAALYGISSAAAAGRSNFLGVSKAESGRTALESGRNKVHVERMGNMVRSLLDHAGDERTALAQTIWDDPRIMQAIKTVCDPKAAESEAQAMAGGFRGALKRRSPPTTDPVADDMFWNNLVHNARIGY